jgi:hypothetical protein
LCSSWYVSFFIVLMANKWKKENPDKHRQTRFLI